MMSLFRAGLSALLSTVHLGQKKDGIISVIHPTFELVGPQNRTLPYLGVMNLAASEADYTVRAGIEGVISQEGAAPWPLRSQVFSYKDPAK
jgi:hypothetical protein